MSTTTPNLGLIKPDPSEQYDIMVFNGNSDLIDTAVHDLSQSVSDAAPIFHSTTQTTYGIGYLNVYGHVKLTDSVNLTLGELSGTAATPLAVKTAYDLANSKASSLFVSTTLTTPWDGTGPWTKTVTLPNILSTDRPIIGPSLSSTQSTRLAQLEAWNLITKATASSGQITFYADEAMPAISFQIQIQVVR